MTRRCWTLILAAVAALAEIPDFAGSAVDADTFGEIAAAAVRGIGVAAPLVAAIAAAVAPYPSPNRVREPAAR